MTLDELLKDPDFQQSSPDSQRWAASQVDKKFAAQTRDAQDKLLKGYNERLQSGMQQGSAQVQESQQNQTMFQKVMAPVTNAVGLGVEAATTPLVGIARVANGEQPNQALGPETWKSVGAGGVAGKNRQKVAEGIVPQTPWQAGAIASQFVPGVSQLTAPARIGVAAAGAGGLQGLLGEKGAVEGGSTGDVAGEALTGALKGGLTQSLGEGLGKLGGATARHTPGLMKKANDAETARVVGGVGKLAPEYAGAGKTSQAAGEFFTGSGQAQEAASGAFKGGIDRLEQALVQATGSPYIQSPELMGAFQQLVRQYGKDPALHQQILQLAPLQGRFLPEQAAKIVALTGQRLSTGEGAALHMKDQAMDDLVGAIERSLPQAAQGILSATRGQYARSSALGDLMASAFQPSNKGYQIDPVKLMQAVSKDPEMIKRLGGQQPFEELVRVLTRGASGKPGYSDVPGGNWNFVPVSSTGVKATVLKHLLQRYKYVGEKPLTVPQGAKQGLGVAASAAASRVRPSDQED